MTIEINLANASGRNYAGKPNGWAFREQQNLDDVDVDGTEFIKLIIPEYAYGITSSYFVGLFSKSMILSGSEERFKNRIDLSTASKSQKDCMENAIHHVFLAQNTHSVF
jgi:hypothetical protein